MAVTVSVTVAGHFKEESSNKIIFLKHNHYTSVSVISLHMHAALIVVVPKFTRKAAVNSCY